MRTRLIEYRCLSNFQFVVREAKELQLIFMLQCREKKKKSKLECYQFYAPSSTSSSSWMQGKEDMGIPLEEIFLTTSLILRHCWYLEYMFQSYFITISSKKGHLFALPYLSLSLSASIQPFGKVKAALV